MFTLLYEKKSILLQRHDKFPNECQTFKTLRMYENKLFIS